MKHSAIPAVAAIPADTGQSLTSARLPHLTSVAFCLTSATRAAIERANDDRRLTRVKGIVADGGIAKALQIFETRPTPSLLVVEVATTGNALLAELDALAEVCDPETKVVVIGAQNDISLYRTLIGRGIAEYLVTKITALAYVTMLQRLFGQDAGAKLGKVYAFLGAKGGVGASTLAQNFAWTIAEEQESPTLLLDLDFRFGSAVVNLDLKPVSGLEKYVDDASKLDAALLDRLVVQRGAFLSVLPGFEDRLGDIDPAPDAVERLVDIARASFPYVVVDLPHAWSPSGRDALTTADEVIIVAQPDLTNLRNAKALVERLRALRPNDAPPWLLLNACQMPRRKEITPANFAKSIGVAKFSSIAFDAAVFGTAAAEGRTIREQAPRSASQTAVRRLVNELTGRRKPRSRLRQLFGLA